VDALEICRSIPCKIKRTWITWRSVVLTNYFVNLPEARVTVYIWIWIRWIGDPNYHVCLHM